MITWLANLSGARHRRRSSLMPRRPMRPDLAQLARELVAAARAEEIAGRDNGAPLQAATIAFILREDDADHARQLAVAWNWVTVLSVLLGITSATLLGLTFLCVGAH